VNVYDRMQASECHAADVCVMDPACPFVKDCRMVEDDEPEIDLGDTRPS
jgi:hypothetical protein